MISRKTKTLEAARERLQPLTQEELTQVSGGWCGPSQGHHHHHRRRHHHRHHRNGFPFFGCGGNPFPY
jgi:hypothetical protein